MGLGPSFGLVRCTNGASPAAYREYAVLHFFVPSRPESSIAFATYLRSRIPAHVLSSLRGRSDACSL